jgi:alpha-N-arabinofuranosidase
VFLVNRSQGEPISVTIDVSALGEITVLDAQTLSDDDVYAKNTLDEPERVGLRANDSAELAEGQLTLVLPAVSWTAVSLGA